MSTNTSVKHFHHAMPGAPNLHGASPGTLIDVLDATLVNGWGLSTAESLVVSGGIATATFSTGHSFGPDVIALVTGATPAGLNGEKRVLTTSANTITFDAPDIADGAATGTVAIKIASAGWEKVFAEGSVAVYRSADPSATGMYLRVDDTDGRNARVVGYESMSSVSSGVGPFPTGAQRGGGGYWPKAADTSATARAWTVVATSKTFYLHMHTSASSIGATGNIWGFGDFISYKSVDPYACAIWSASSDISTQSGSTNVQCLEWVNGTSGAASPYVARSYTGVGASISGVMWPETYWSGSGTSGGASSQIAPSFPNGPNNGLLLNRALVVESGAALRGVLPGILHSPQNCFSSFATRSKLNGAGSYFGRKLLAVRCGSPNGSTALGVVFFDITGPWE